MSADFDKAIDRAVREMLDVEPPAGLRQRVVGRLPRSSVRPARWLVASSCSWKIPSLVASTLSWKILVPVAAAAALMLAILLPRSTPQGPRGAETRTAAGQTPRPPVTEPPSANDPPANVEVPQPVSEPRTVAARRGPAARRSVTATAFTPYDSPVSGIGPLTAINAIAVAPITERTIAPAEITLRPLTPITEVQVAPLTPPERRN